MTCWTSPNSEPYPHRTCENVGSSEISVVALGGYPCSVTCVQGYLHTHDLLDLGKERDRARACVREGKRRRGREGERKRGREAKRERGREGERGMERMGRASPPARTMSLLIRTRSSHLRLTPQTPKPKTQCPNPKPHTLNPKPQTPNLKPQTPNPKPNTQNPKQEMIINIHNIHVHP